MPFDGFYECFVAIFFIISLCELLFYVFPSYFDFWGRFLIPSRKGQVFITGIDQKKVRSTIMPSMRLMILSYKI